MGARPRVAVVGGGMSGIACADRLRGAGLEVVVIDRGHRLGGRMATRTMRGTGLPYDGRVVDVGASYLTASTDAFGELVSAWAARGLVVPWTDRFHVADRDGLDGTSPGPVRYAAPGGLRGLVEDLAADLPVVIAPRAVEDVVRDGDGVLVDGERFDVAVLAMPGPQAADLLADDDPAAEQLAWQEWSPALTLVAAYDERCWDEFDGIFVNESPVLLFVADDGRRRGDGAPVLVAHAQAELAAANLDDPSRATAELVAALTEIVGATAQPVWTEVRRWSLARVVEPGLRTHWFDGTIGLCGDAWSDVSRVEAAYLSGLALADAVLARR
ncbi:MAG: FAD-dependent oxidoreductase [Candidatus Nanopelagicales bacterium]